MAEARSQSPGPFDLDRPDEVTRVQRLARPPAEPVTALLIFVAMLAPMLTVASIRRWLVDVHGGPPSSVHLFVAIGMVGSFLGAPAIAAFADARGRHLRIAGLLAVVDAGVTFTSLFVGPLWVLFALRVIHGAASMGALSLLLGRFGGGARALVSRAGAAMIAALALGPALGGMIGRADPARAFATAGLVSAVLALVLLRSPPVASTPSEGKHQRWPRALAARAKAPLVVLATQRLALGGMVGAFAVDAKATHRMSDAMVGGAFSLLLFAFGATTFLVGRELRRPQLGLVVGAVSFATALFVLALGPTRAVPFALVLAGVGAGFVYAPSLARVTALAEGHERASAMALVHAAGAVGMVAGPLLAVLVDAGLHVWPPAARASAFLFLAGVLQLFVTGVAGASFGQMVDRG